eukprot:symbB.v1.2.022097.t1/scaffold1946.1/size95412/9
MVGACRRKVRAVKRHYYFLVVNLVLSLVIARPLWLCDCFCFEPSQDLVMTPRSSTREAQQCDIWTSFEDVSSSRRLAAKGDQWPNCGKSQLLVVPDLFKVSKNASLRSSRRSCVELPFTQTWASVLLDMDKGALSDWDYSKLQLQDFHSEMLSCFKTRRCGAIYIEVTHGPHGEANEGTDTPNSNTSFCGNITLCKLVHPVLPTENQQMPAVDDQHCPSLGWTLSLLKDMEEYECFRFRIGAQNGPATELCHLVVRGSLTLLFLANAIAISSAIVIRKFLENNCGDFIDTEEQFAVDYGDSRMSIADSFVAGAYDATSYFRGPKDPLRPRSFSQGGNVELSSRGMPSNWQQDGNAGI